MNTQRQEVGTVKPFDFPVLCILPPTLVFSPPSHHFKWDAVNDFVPGSHYAGSRDMHALSHENY